MQPYPPDNPQVVNGVPVYVIPACIHKGRAVVDTADPMYDHKYFDDLHRAIGASNMPLADRRVETVSKLLDLAQPSIAEGAVYHCVMGDVDLVFVPLVVNHFPWYYTHWDKIISPDPRPQRTPEQQAERKAAKAAADAKRRETDNRFLAELELEGMMRLYPTEFRPGADLGWMQTRSSMGGRNALVLWMMGHSPAEITAMLCKVGMARLTSPQLKALLKANGQPVGGKKHDLVQRAQRLPQQVQLAALEDTHANLLR